MTSPELKISQYRTMHGKNPSAAWLAVACKITPHEAERLLSQGELFHEQKDEQATRSEIPNFPGTKPASVGVFSRTRETISEPEKHQVNGMGSDAGRVGGEAPDIREDEGKVLPTAPDSGRPEVAGIRQYDIPDKPDENHGLIDRLVTKFIGAIKSFVFLSASFGDLSLTVFFYWSLGYDLPSKLVWGLWAVTQTLGKLYLWHVGYKKSAVWAAVLSVIATVSIFLAVIDTQSVRSIATNSHQESAVILSLESQITAKGVENKTLTERLANTPPDYVGASRTITNTIKANDEALRGLREELNKELQAEKTIVEPQFELSAWVVFGQLTNFKWGDPSHIFALVLILGIAIFFEVLIYATTPRKIGGHNELR